MLKAFLIAAGLVVVLLTASGVAMAAYLVSGGLASVQVHTEEVHLSLPVPTRVIDLGLGIASVAAPRHELRKLHEEIGFEDWQALDAFARELADCPDGEFVRVRTNEEWVSVSKRRGKLRIEVEAPDVQLEVSLPDHAFARIVKRVGVLAGAA